MQATAGRRWRGRRCCASPSRDYPTTACEQGRMAQRALGPTQDSGQPLACLKRRLAGFGRPRRSRRERLLFDTAAEGDKPQAQEIQDSGDSGCGHKSHQPGRQRVA